MDQLQLLAFIPDEPFHQSARNQSQSLSHGSGINISTKPHRFRDEPFLSGERVGETSRKTGDFLLNNRGLKMRERKDPICIFSISQSREETPESPLLSGQSKSCGNWPLIYWNGGSLYFGGYQEERTLWTLQNNEQTWTRQRLTEKGSPKTSLET